MRCLCTRMTEVTAYCPGCRSTLIARGGALFVHGFYIKVLYKQGVGYVHLMLLTCQATQLTVMNNAIVIFISFLYTDANECIAIRDNTQENVYKKPVLKTRKI